MEPRSLVRYMARKAQEIAQDTRAFETGYVTSATVGASADVKSSRNQMISTAVPYQDPGGTVDSGHPVLIYRVDGSASQKCIMGHSPYTVPQAAETSTTNYDVLP